MPNTLLLVPWIALQAATFAPSTVPARGKADATLTLTEPGYYRIQAQSPTGTSCEIVDQLRGPFAQDGARGRSSCDLQVLLDAGVYRLRLSSIRKGKGRVALSVSQFKELNPEPIQMKSGQTVQGQLRLLEQASYSFRVAEPRTVLLRAAGQNAGDLRLWRGGEFVERLDWQNRDVTPRAGQPIHEWFTAAKLEPGDYRFTVYGANPLTWTEGKADNHLSVSLDFPEVGRQGNETITLPPSGFWAVTPAKGALGAVITAPADLDGRVEAATFLAESQPFAKDSTNAGCEVPRKALWRECGLSSDVDERHVLWVRGPPGASINVQWAPMAVSGHFVDGAYGPPINNIGFEGPADGDFLLSTHDVPPDIDGAPMSCSLTTPGAEQEQVLFRDTLAVASGGSFERTFNYDGSHELVEFKIISPGRYHITTTGQRKSLCEIYRVEGEEGKRLAGSDPKGAAKCDFTLPLASGAHQLTLSSGTMGIETLRIAPQGSTAHTQTPAKTSCLFPKLKLIKGRTYSLNMNRSGAAAARGVHLRPLPLQTTTPLPLDLAPGQKLSLPIAANQSFLVRVSSGNGLRCGWEGSTIIDAREGVCALPPQPAAAIFRLEAKGNEPVHALLVPPTPSRPSPPIVHLAPKPVGLPSLQPDVLAFFSLAKSATHSRVFDVVESGLYDLTTEGLLATRCSLRTPVEPMLASDLSGGRGRNCLVAQYLRPGRYVVTVQAEGQSKGRAALRLSRRPVLEAQSVAADGEAFFRVSANELVQEKLTTRKGGTHHLSTVTTSASAMTCRLEDSQGWPILAIPTPCDLRVALPKGQYRWTQLPATVDTQRRTQIEKIVQSPVLRGNAAHPLALNGQYTADLGKDGKDEFLFTLAADAPIRIALTNGMQGRLYQADDLKREHALEVVPPNEEPAPPQADAASEGDSTERGEEESGYEGDGEGDEGSEGSPRAESRSPPPEAPEESLDVADPPGHPLDLKAGSYRLVTEHSRGDVAIRYTVSVASPLLLPGTARDLAVPSRVRVRVPQNGILRLTTQGTSDVRCRLLDSEGQLLAESSDRGVNWNCALAEPIRPGDHWLVLESENGLKGTTRVQIESPPIREMAQLGALTDWKVATEVLRTALPNVGTDILQSIEMSSTSDFSCALEDAASGAVVQHTLSTKRCGIHVRPKGHSYRVRVWTAGETANVKVTYEARDIVNGRAGTLPKEGVLRISVPRAGRYRTSDAMLCISDDQPGPLWRCGAEVSLEKGTYVFASAERQKAQPLSLSEQIAQVDKPLIQKWRLTSWPFIQTQAARQPSVHLFSATVAPGARSTPACRLAGGVYGRTALGCYAASPVSKEAEGRVWIKGGEDDASMSQLSVPLPSTILALNPGIQPITWKEAALRVKLPSAPHRVDWTLPAQTWAVQLDGAGKPIDLCLPLPTLNHCRMWGQGGEAVIYSAVEHRAEAEVEILESLAAPRGLSTLYEDVPISSGVLRFTLAAGSMERALEVIGAVSCVLDREDGVRDSRCETTLPAGVAARLTVEHRASALRATLVAREARMSTLAQDAPQPGARIWQPGNRLVPKGPAAEELAIAVLSESVFRLESDSGVCGLWRAPVGSDPLKLLAVEGSGEKCVIQRVLTPGKYLVRIRPFGSSPLRGGAAWSTRPIDTLKEGVGAESWAGAGEARYYRFQTGSEGRVGLGLQAPSDILDCAVLDSNQNLIGDGCQQLLSLPQGTFFLMVHAPADEGPQRFKPVLVGLAGAKTAVPREFLEAFFNRIGEKL